MNLFRKRTKEPGPAAVKVAGKIAGGLLLVQSKWANGMQGLTERLSPKAKLACLVLFVLAGLFTSIYHLRTAVSGSRPDVMRIGTIPQPTLTPGQEGAIITNREFLNIQRFKAYLDSLARSPSGKRMWDSILQNRAGLMDSMAVIDEQFRLQHIQKER